MLAWDWDLCAVHDCACAWKSLDWYEYDWIVNVWVLIRIIGKLWMMTRMMMVVWEVRCEPTTMEKDGKSRRDAENPWEA